jgi:hypothetical protein
VITTGGITIIHAEGNLHWVYRGISEPLSIGTTIRLSCPRRPARLLPDRLAISFSTDRRGKIASLPAPFEPLVKHNVFACIPGGHCTSPAFRHHCTRRFSHGDTIVVVG